MRIGICTAFSTLTSQYSLTRVVVDQILMIHHAGHQAVLMVVDDFNVSEETMKELRLPEDLEIRRTFPVFHKTDYKSAADLTPEHREVSEKSVGRLLHDVQDLDVIFTHDILFTGWNLPLNIAVHQVAARCGKYWLHWVHSVPGGGRRPFWRLPINGKLVYPNHTDRIRCAEHFETRSENVLVIPHSLDPRNFLMETEEGRELTTRFHLLDADFVQTLPVPTDRMEHKGLEQVITILGKIKQQNRSVRLVVPNAWCTTDLLREKVKKAQAFAAMHGLNENEVIFTSVVMPKHAVGLPNRVVRDLMLISNLFICPTKSETFGLTIAEAALCGQLLVLNANFPPLCELTGQANALYFTFGSHQQELRHDNMSQFYGDVARIIIHRFDSNESMKAKTHYHQKYSMESVWRTIEAALQAEAIGARLSIVKPERKKELVVAQN